MKNIVFALFSLFSAHFTHAAISGTVTVAPTIQKKLPPGGVLFIFARSAATPERGFPLAVKRIEKPKFPLDFTLSQSDAMVDGTKLEGAVKITARFSPTGDVMAKKGSFEGTVGADQNVVIGKTKSVQVKIDQEIK